MWGMFCNRWFTLIQLLRLYHSYHLPENNDWYKMLSVVMDIITSLGSVLMKVELWWQEVLFFFHKEGAVARENPGSFSFFPFFFLLLNLIFQSCCGRVLVSLSCCTAAATPAKSPHSYKPRQSHTQAVHFNTDSMTFTDTLMERKKVCESYPASSFYFINRQIVA